jgi:hypothetical protein
MTRRSRDHSGASAKRLRAPWVPDGPARSTMPSVCLDCRTLLWPPVAHCAKGHRVVALATTGGRVAWLNEVWGATAREDPAWRWLRNLAALLGLEAVVLLGLAAGVDLSLTEALGVLMGVAAGSLVLFAILILVARPSPRGAGDSPCLVTNLPEGEAVATGPATLRSPVSGQECAAYFVELCVRRRLRDEVILRMGGTGSLNVAFDDGSSHQVGPGTVYLAGQRKRIAESEETRTLAANLAGWFGTPKNRHVSSLPFEFAMETLLQPGDRVIACRDPESPGIAVLRLVAPPPQT